MKRFTSWLTMGAVLGALLVALPVYAARTVKICIEAENATKVEPHFKVVKTSSKEVGGTGYLAIPGGAGKGKGMATLTFDAPADGTYYLWARSYWEDGCGNSVGAKIDSEPEVVLGNDGTYNHWHWVNAKRTRYVLKKGKHTLTLFNREDGIRVDQLLLVSDKDYVPTRIEK